MTDLLKYNFSVSGTALFLSFDEIYAAARTLFLDLLRRLYTIEYSNIQRRLLTSRSEVKKGQTTTKLQTISLLIDR